MQTVLTSVLQLDSQHKDDKITFLHDGSIEFVPGTAKNTIINIKEELDCDASDHMVADATAKRHLQLNGPGHWIVTPVSRSDFLTCLT